MKLEKVLSDIKLDLFEEIKTQLLKDIQLSGLDLSGKLESPKDLYNSLLNLIEIENKATPQTIMNLLYRVDVKEITVHEVSRNYSVTFEEAMAISILNRTIEKVQFKKKFNI